MHVLCTLLLPTSGWAEVAGFDVARQPIDVRLRIGVAPRRRRSTPPRPASSCCAQGRLYGLTKAETEQRLRDLTQLVDIGPALGHRIKTYSGGMRRRRLDLAAALVHNPQVLFLDEPTTGLDPASRVRVWEEVRRLNAEGITIFLTTQYLEEADARTPASASSTTAT